MPRYRFINPNNSSDVVDLDCSYEEMMKYAENNQHMQQEFRMTIADPVGLGISKPPSDFSKYVLGKVKKAPGADQSKIEKRWQIPKEI